ncbi:DUF11 domain-containing protein [Pseudomonas sp. OF001]|uniref:SdrD B-like domain-containing protein n=1 Tax=Pseudomonas sp. OF001 TaxID=2772300 RepID=UPI00191A32A9|nr:SdrD B-like domain-containing protein [Pseudomonas sp. OF001]CAD5376701.1 DUF11 domain-containing protein [Pseudomonas sp. OF001]
MLTSADMPAVALAHGTRRILRGILCGLLLLGLAVAAWAGTTPSAGSLISNQAQAEYRQTDGSLVRLRSNTVETEVAAVESIALLPDLAVRSSAGASVALAHTLINTGNVATTLTLQFANRSGDGFDLNDLALTQDLNGNGLADAGEPSLPPGSSLTLAAGQRLYLLLTARVPAALAYGRQALLQLSAHGAAGASAQVDDSVTIDSTVAPRLDKEVTPQSAIPGATLRYRLALNSGDGWRPKPVLVDGALQELLLVRDPLPTNTEFVAFVAGGGAQALYHLAGMPRDEYQSQAPAERGRIDAIAFGFPAPAALSQAELEFDLRLGAAASGTVVNTATVEGLVGAQEQRVESNPARVSLPVQPGALDYRDPRLVDKVTLSSSGLPLNLRAEAAACNLGAASIESWPLNLSTALSGDLETLTITETGPNTGIFVLTSVPTAPWPQNRQVSSDGTVQVASSDTVTATLSCAGQTLVAAVLIDPAGVVFDSQSGAPLAGATVRLIEIGAAGERPATVFDFNAQPAPSSVVTGPDGRYEFPLVAAGDYRLEVTPPNGYRFPSQVPAAQQPAGRRIGDGSFGGRFRVDAAVLLDVPLDPGTLSGLALQKQGARNSVEIGETLRYTLRLSNNTGRVLDDLVIEDRLPAGFTYLPGSTRQDRELTVDPARLPGRRLVFRVGSLASGRSLQLDYTVRVGSGATAGDGINQAQAHSGDVSSNLARFAVQIEKGVFADDAFILGKVYADCDRNRVQDPGEPGIPGVRLYLDDGSFVITDSEGKYSFYGVSPRTHSLKLDPITLPAGAEMETIANRQAGDAQSRFVDLRNGELHRADFATDSCAAPLREEIERRRSVGETPPARSEEEALTAHLRTEAAPNYDLRARPASGVLDAGGRIVAETPLAAYGAERARPARLSEAPVSRSLSVSLESLLLKRSDNRFGFLDLTDGDTLPGTDLSVRLVGRDGAFFRLLVNGEEVPSSRVGQRARMPSRQLLAWEYIGVKLKPGSNRLRAEALDAFGNLRESTEITLIAPGRAGKLLLVLPPSGGVADGQTPIPVMVRLRDADDVPVTARTLITLESSAGRWDAEDLDPLQEGVQTLVQGGEALFDLIPPADPGSARVRVSSGVLEAEERLAFTPYLRPLVATGVIEGAVGINRLSADAMAAVSPEDTFEQDIRRLSGGGGDSRVGARGSMFLKGKVKGDYLLTLAYDSDKDTRDRLFRDIEPESFYPVYGDSSIKGFDAQSTSPLYVRIDKGRSYLLYGDFNTAADPQPARQLANYSRSLTGVQQHIETDRVVVNLFASHDSSRQQVNEFRAQGISGPYRLPGSGFLRNSEQIEILVRDRNQPSVVLESRTLTRFVDYTVDELAGSIMFSRPVASVDANLNPVFIRITWEVDSGGETFWVYGADGRYRLTEFLEVGGSVVRNDDPVEGYSLFGLNATVTLAEDHSLTLEAARSEEDLGSAGNAWRAEWLRTGRDVEGRVFAAQSDETFNNPNAALSSGRRELGVNAAVRVTEQLRLNAEALHTESLDTGGRRQGLYGGTEYALTPRVTLATGLRYTREDEAAPLGESLATGARDVTSAYGKLGWNPDFLPRANVYSEYEQDLSASANRMFGIGGDYQISQRGRLYARHELISSLSGAFGLSELSEQQNTTVFGLDHDYREDGNVFSEYRVRDAIDGPSAQAAMGLRNGWALQPGLRLTTQFERVHPLDGLSQENSAIALGLHYTANPLWKGGTRLEWRESDTENSLLHTVSYVRRLSSDWSFLGKNTVSLVERLTDDSGDLLRNRLRLGLAWRQTEVNRWNWLGRYESRYDRDEQEDERRHAHVLSSHVNYQPHRQWVLSGRYAFKQVNDDNGDVDNRFTGHLLSGRVLYDLSERWDLGFNVSRLFDPGSTQYGYGAEVGYLLAKNLWVSGGYNFAGYHDRDFEDVDYTQQGPYLRLRFKFDENNLRWLE